MLINLDNAELLAMLQDMDHLGQRIKEARSIVESNDDVGGTSTPVDAVDPPPVPASQPPQPVRTSFHNISTPQSGRSPGAVDGAADSLHDFEQDYFPDTSLQAIDEARRELVARMHEENERRAAEDKSKVGDARGTGDSIQDLELPPTQPYDSTAKLVQTMAEVGVSQQERVSEQTTPQHQPADHTCSPTLTFHPQQPRQETPGPHPWPTPPAAVVPVGDTPERSAGSDGSVASVLLRPPAVQRQKTETGAIARGNSAMSAFPKRESPIAPTADTHGSEEGDDI